MAVAMSPHMGHTVAAMSVILRSMRMAIAFLLVWSSGIAIADEPSERFVLLFDGEAVRDTKTGLVWEREPDYVFDVWDRSLARCGTKAIGGQRGWRAPSIEEIKTLVDPEQQDPSLPAGHPFRNIRSGIYWTATPHPTDDIVAWQQSFFSGQAVTDQKSGTRRMWCLLDHSPR